MKKTNVLLKGHNKILVRDESGKSILKQNEIDCKCHAKNCTIALLTDSNLGAYKETRLDFGSPVIVTSCYRCMDYNSSGKVKGEINSNHLKGDAIDLVPKNGDLDGLEKSARKFYKFVLRYKKFIHCDNRLTQEIE